MDDKIEIELLEEDDGNEMIMKTGIAGNTIKHRKIEQGFHLQSDKPPCYTATEPIHPSRVYLPATDSVDISMPAPSLNTMPFQVPGFHFPHLPTVPRMPYSLSSAFWPSQQLIQPIYFALPAGQSPTEQSGAKKAAVQKSNETSGDGSDVKRMVFDRNQLSTLETVFRENMYPTSKKKEQLAESLGTPYGKVVTWFQNRRAKNRRLQKDKELTNLKTLKQLVDTAQKYQDGTTASYQDFSALENVSESNAAAQNFYSQSVHVPCQTNSSRIRSLFVRRRSEHELASSSAHPTYEGFSYQETGLSQDNEYLRHSGLLADVRKAIGADYNHGHTTQDASVTSLVERREKGNKNKKKVHARHEVFTKEQREVLLQQVVALDENRGLQGNAIDNFKIVESSKYEIANNHATLVASDELQPPSDLKPAQICLEENAPAN